MVRPVLSILDYGTREAWLEAAISKLRENYAAVGYPLPDTIKVSIGFTSKGIGTRVGEHWHGDSNEGNHHIYISPTQNDPLRILGILAHELCHAAVPVGSAHGPKFKQAAHAIGLEGKMIHALPGKELNLVLKSIMAQLGDFPHSAVHQSKTIRKAQKRTPYCLCKACGYKASVGKKFLADFGAPFCPVDMEQLVSVGSETNDEE